MRRLLFLALFIGTIVSGEALYRWSNALELGWGWLGGRVAFFVIVLGVSHLASRREARRASGPGTGNGLVMPILFLVWGGAGLIIWVWRLVEALATGRISVSTAPEAYTARSANPGGFAMAVGVDILAAILFLLMFVFAVLTIWNAIRARKGPAWP